MGSAHTTGFTCEDLCAGPDPAVGVNDPKRHVIPVKPFAIVDRGPMEEAAYIDAASDGVMKDGAGRPQGIRPFGVVCGADPALVDQQRCAEQLVVPDGLHGATVRSVIKERDRSLPLGAVDSNSLASRFATHWSSLGQFAEFLGNSFGGGKGRSGIANGRPAELVSDCVDGPVQSPSRGFDDRSGSKAHISLWVGRVER